MTDEEKNSIELDIEAKYVGRTEKEFLNTITYAECLYILDTKNKYCDDIKTLSLLKIVDIVNEQSKEIEELKEQCKEVVCIPEGTCFMLEPKDINKKWEDKIKAKIEEWDKDIKWNNADDHYYAIKMMQSLLEKE